MEHIGYLDRLGMNMDKPANNEEHDFLISLKDCLEILKKGKFKIIGFALSFATIAALYSLTKPVKFEAEATFKEKTNSQTGLNSSSLASIFFSGLSVGGKNEAITMMKSRKLLKRVISALGLQSTLIRQKVESPILENIKKNFALEFFNTLRSSLELPLKDDFPVLRVSNIEFSKEVPETVTLVFESENIFQVFGRDNTLLGSAKIGFPFSSNDYSFTLIRLNDDPLTGSTYHLSLSPFITTYEQLSKNIIILSDKEDSSLLRLKYANKNRHLASEMLNILMEEYQGYLKEEQNRIAREQIAYLQSRQKEMGQNFRNAITEYADQLSLDVAKTGYAHSEKMFDFLTDQLHGYWQKMLTIELELQRQSVPQPENFALANLYLPEHSSSINEVLNQIRILKQEGDSLELSLRNSSVKDVEEWQNTFLQQIAFLEEIRQSANETKILLENLENNRLPLPYVKLLDNPKYKIRIWYDQLKELKSSAGSAVNTDEQITFKAHFTAYLLNLLHFLEVSEKTIQERLAHQQAPQFEFQGIDLNSANQLYIDYTKNLNNVESQILQLQFIINQLQQPGFEVTSLSTVVEDPITLEMVSDASKLIMSLRDEANHSTKEKERLKNEIQTQKQFLDLHLNQTVQLLKLQESLYKEKIRSLQKASLELIQQQVSIREKEIANHIELYLEYLKLDHDLLKQKEQDIRLEMVNLPQKWASEKLIEQELKINVAMVEEIAKIVESKNITSNLEMVQSASLDTAIPPTHPLPPRILLYTILGSILGLLLGMGSQLIYAIFHGIRASKDNLNLAGVHVSGMITKNKEENRETFRRVVARLLNTPFSLLTNREGSTFALINSSVIDPKEIITLMNKKGWKVLLLNLTFAQSLDQEQLPALLQYLEGAVASPKIHKRELYDEIDSGGKSLYANELLTSKTFLLLIEKLKGHYDWIIGISSASPCSSEAEMMLKLFDHSLIALSTETLNELSRIIQLAKATATTKKTSFLFVKN
jgi:tyrosine-protein kinase Etk/Wzc